MTSKRPLSISPIRDDQRESQLNKLAKIGICQVCGDKARIFNYGALSCPSCKTFFRRHGFHSTTVPSCDYNGNCPITLSSRRNCTACRFGKCLAVGMSPAMIRKEDLYEKNRSLRTSKHKIASAKLTSPPQPCSLSLLSTDRSTLTSANWTLLSNVVHAFDTYNPVPDASNIVKYVSMPIRNMQPDVENSLKMMTIIYTSLQSFINSTADFRIMTTVEQCSLFQRNMQGLLAFYAIYSFRESDVFHNKHTENALVPLYGSDDVQCTKRITTRLDYDLTLTKLMLVTLSFSSNCFMINDEERLIRDSFLYGTFRLFGSQNVYAELIWRYMTYRYGFSDAVRRFDGLIKVALDGIKIASDIYENNKIHQTFADEISEHCERSLTLNDNENTPLWGKTYS